MPSYRHTIKFGNQSFECKFSDESRSPLNVMQNSKSQTKKVYILSEQRLPLENAFLHGPGSYYLIC
ncbi:hypothetical protein ACTXT7_004408 [Hymenolepis weldensis]